ncbi:glycoside hydrolase family 2 [Pyrrhoderma noxium]|uniref:Beta-mannosidase B n=1 Tax=Pyrrhoderma noxium TaxID=2282107 RepID=A0A286UMP9_9AGAM|nr:glycoside hydrolase family 2 [Pyrrhoderma noxium]
MKSKTIPITENWEFTQLGGGQATKENEWLACKSFPTSVHVELLKRNLIPDPFIGLNEWDVQWVGEAEWGFRTSFEIDDSLLSAENVDLIFDGLDTFCKIDLNGETLVETNNQFISYRVPVKKLLSSGANTLVLSFPSSFIKGRELEKQHGKLNLWNGDSSRLHIRKAQYNYGWDWGPVLMTVGPWRPVSLHAYTARVSDLHAVIDVAEDLSIKSNITFEINGTNGDNLQATYNLTTSEGATILKGPIVIENGKAQATFETSSESIELWYPVGYGKQTLYSLQVSLCDEQGNVVDTAEKRIGFRRVRVVQDELEGQSGHSFLFEINNTRIFCGGSNWIPADSFLTTMTPQRYRDWLQLLVDGNQNMIRIWGGGIYEPDCFYDICDELGILVWHDFMFGCGQYPAYDSFLASVEVEAEQNVKRLRHHPSIVIFAGNNEDYQIAESLKLELDYDDEKSDFRKTNFPARHIYERLLPAIVANNSEIYYHRSSPYSGFGQPTTDKTNGDLHQWNVWHGSQEPWHNWDILAGRFVSEFGMEGYPNIRTVDYWLGGDKEERHPQSRTNCNHNKADGFERRLELYLMENFKHAFDIESYVYYTQIMQAETLSSAYRLWRRNWRGRGKEYTAGALVWQLNDCWPVTSWAIVDYFLRPKPAYFAISRELRPFTVGMTRKEKKIFASDNRAADFTIDTEVEIWGTNNQLEEKTVTLDVRCFDLRSEWTDSWSKQVVLASNASTELWKGILPGQPTRTKLSEVPKTIIISARLLDGNTVLGRYSNWPEPFKYIHFPPVETSGLNIETKEDGETLILSCKKPIKGIILDVEGEDVKWGDQAIDLVPGDEQVVKASGLKGRSVKARYLGDGTA